MSKVNNMIWLKHFCCISVLLFLSLPIYGQFGLRTAKNNNVFAFDLFRSVFKKDSNMLISPYSVSSSLAMTYAGAGGETAEQMCKVLHFDSTKTNTHQGFSEINASLAKYKNDSVINLSIANALWQDNKWPIKPGYLELTKKFYNSAIFPLNGADSINKWVNIQTNRKITDLVKEEDLNNSRLVLTNAVYFKGDWLKRFNVTLTKKDSFETISGKKYEVDMMFQENDFKYFEDEKNQILELPYKNELFSMLVILPKGNSSTYELINGVDNGLFEHYNSQLVNRTVKLSIPKFSFSSKVELSSTLEKMGMPNAFNSQADFSGMSPGLYINNVIHKAFIQVDESGSEAAAASAVIMTELSMQTVPIEFNAKRSFVFVISDKGTKTILFIGSLINTL